MGASAREHDDVGTYDARAVGRHPARGCRDRDRTSEAQRRQPLVPAGRHGGLWRGIGRLYWIGNNEKQSFASLRHKQRYSRLSDNSTYRVDDGTVYLLRISDRAQAPAFGRASLLGRTEIDRILIFSGTGLHPRRCNPVFHVENRPSEVSRPRPWRLRLWFCRAVRRGRRRARRSGRRRPCGG